MTKPRFLTPKFIESAIRFVVYFLAVALTPMLGYATAVIWNWVAYSFLRGLFAEIHTVFFWLCEALIFRAVAKALKKRGKLPSAVVEGETEEKCEANEAPMVEGKAKKAKKPKQCAPLLPVRNVFILTGICVACVLVISAVIGFKVKPFYDLGEKITGYDLWVAVGGIGRNAFKCMWIVAMLRNALVMADELLQAYAPRKAWLRWFIAFGILILFGLFDIFTSVVSAPLGVRGWLTAVTYFVFYAAFTAIYYFTQENRGKAYLLIAFVYLF